MRNILRLSMQQDPFTLDPQKNGDRFSSSLIFLLYRGLTRFEEDHRVTCDLAKSFHILNNYKKYVFHLGEHFWSDGSPITAHDFVYSWKRALCPDFPLKATNFFDYIKNASKARNGLVPLDKVGICAKDDFTLEVELEECCPYFLELTSYSVLFPISSRVEECQASSIFSGPFQLQHWSPGEEILLTKNPLYSQSDIVKIDGLHFRIISDAKEAFDLYERDELDWIGDPISPLPANYLPALLRTKKIKPIMGLAGCWFNTQRPPFNNVNLRRAFAIAISREQLLNRLLLPNPLSAKRFFPSMMQESENVISIQECLKTAQELFHTALKELKAKRLKIVMTYEEIDEFSRLAVFLKTHWEEAFNVSIHLEPLPFKELWQRLPQKQFEMGLVCSLSQYTDLINFLERFEYKSAPRNFSGWENADFQRILAQYRKTTEHEKRKQLAIKAETLLLNEMPVAPLYHYQFTYLQKNHVRNFCLSPIGVIQFDRMILDRRYSALQEGDSFDNAWVLSEESL